MAVDLHYYEVLGVKPEASSGQCLLWLVVAMKLLNEQKAEIKRAYKKKALQSHPDKNPDNPTAAQDFQDISTAYETLIDDHKRAHYDRFGRDQGSSGMFEDDMSVDSDELFAHLFGGMGMGPGMFDMGGMGPEPSRGHGRRSQDSIITYEVTLEDLYNGKNVQMNMTRDIDFDIRKGMEDRARITLSKQGDQVPGKETGDLIFVLQLQDHQSFDRHGHSLMTVVNITLSEALTGFNRVLFTHLDGRGIRVASVKNKIVRSQDVIKITGEGMPIPNSSRKGDLYVTFVVDMPDDEWLKALDQIALEALVKLLPPKKPDPPANTVTDVSYTNADTSELQFDDEWEDSDEEEEEEGPQCRHQ
ncbi:DnaJ-like protein xdj1 [Rhizoctonia solani]